MIKKTLKYYNIKTTHKQNIHKNNQSKTKTKTKKNKNNNKQRKNKKQSKNNKSIDRKNRNHKHIIKGGAPNSSDGFIIEIDKDNIPVNNSLDFENAEIFIRNFLFTDDFITNYLEKDSDLPNLFSSNIDLSQIYSGDKTKLINLVEDYIAKDINKALKIFKIIDPKSHSGFIKNLYKKEEPTRSYLLPSSYKSSISVYGGGGSGPNSNNEEYNFSSINSNLPVSIEPVASFAPSPVPAPAPAPVDNLLINVVVAGVCSVIGAAGKIISNIPMSLLLSRNYRRHVISYNYGENRQFVVKISVLKKYIDLYKTEYEMYKLLKDDRYIEDPPACLLENVFNFHNETADFDFYEDPVIVTLNFTYGGIELKKNIDLNNCVDDAYDEADFGNNKINWGALIGVYNPLHIDFRDIIVKSSYKNINTNSDKIKTALELIFNNLECFYIRAGLLHCDFKTDNILIELDSMRSNIVGAYMFDLDRSYKIPRYFYDKYTIRKSLDDKKISPFVYEYSGKLQKINNFTAGFLHFFDCYMAALTLIDNVNKNPVTIIQVDNAVNAMVWKSDPAHSINLFKVSYELIKISGITSHRIVNDWDNLEFDRISSIIINAYNEDRYPEDSELPKDKTFKWICNYLNLTEFDD